ncbi:hypothetical protein B0H14DRAFT_2622668 [Mycena olivaceomarginata]|nr:hypothetical protein B0H14DRAFT_2622668 [Mycena olivaceomarginata]
MPQLGYSQEWEFRKQYQIAVHCRYLIWRYTAITWMLIIRTLCLFRQEIIFELCYKEFDKKALESQEKEKKINKSVFWREVEMVLMDFNECCTPLGRAMSVTGGEDSDSGADAPAAGRAFWATGVVSAPRESSEKSLSGLLTERARDAKRRDRGAEVARRDLAAEVARAGVRAVGLGSADGSPSDLIVGIGEAILECARRECATGRIRSVLDSIKVTGGEGGRSGREKK